MKAERAWAHEPDGSTAAYQKITIALERWERARRVALLTKVKEAFDCEDECWLELTRCAYRMGYRMQVPGQNAADFARRKVRLFAQGLPGHHQEALRAA